MLDKYFFIPASNKKFIYNILKIKADKFVFDLEDAINVNDFNIAVNNLLDLEINSNYWIRFPFLDSRVSELNKLINAGFRNFIVPKVENIEDFRKVLSYFDNQNKKFDFIILVENPKLLLNLSIILDNFNKQITGIGLGSHDYTAIMNMQHDFENLYYARNLILNYAKANSILAFDIASMEIDNESKLKEEFISAVRMGFDAKFFIHPKQLDIFNRTQLFSKEEIKEAFEIISLLQDETEYAAFKYKGKIYEKPHINRLKKIKEWADKYERI